MKKGFIKSDVLTPRWLRQTDQLATGATVAIATVCAALALGLVVSVLQRLEPSYVQFLHRLFG